MKLIARIAKGGFAISLIYLAILPGRNVQEGRTIRALFLFVYISILCVACGSEDKDSLLQGPGREKVILDTDTTWNPIGLG